MLTYYKLSNYYSFYLQDIKIILPFCKKLSNMWTELSDPAILKKLGIQIREYLMKMEMIQNELAEKSKVSMGSVVRLEKCNPVSILLFISVLRMLGILENLKVLLPELGISPIQMRQMQEKKENKNQAQKEYMI